MSYLCPSFTFVIVIVVVDVVVVVVFPPYSLSRVPYPSSIIKNLHLLNLHLGIPSQDMM